MSVFMAILGILLIVLGGLCAVTPLTTFMATGYFVAIVLIVSGVVGILNSFYFRFFGWNLIVSILAVALGVLAFTRPGGMDVLNNTLAYMLGLWFLLRGCVTVYLSLKARKLPVNSSWGLGLIVGIIGIALGVYSLIHPIVPAITIGLLVALYFIEQGLDIIAMSRVARAFGE